MKRLLPALALCTCLAAWGQSTEVASPDPLVESRLKGIAEELRCLVCQNQTIADSNAPLALDLEQRLLSRLDAGERTALDALLDKLGDGVAHLADDIG